MDFEFDYYLIANTGEPNVPFLKNNDAVDPRGLAPIYCNAFAEINSPIYLAINPPYPAKPNFNVDFFKVGTCAVYSQKIHDIIIPLNIKGYQLLPGIIVDRQGQEHSNFWLENAYTRIECIDTDKSGCEYLEFGKTWSSFKKIVLKNELLKEIPLEERLIFRPKETREFVFYHKTFVDAIMKAKPINIRFIPVDEWYQGIQFRH